jgi:hypothetical protein
MAKRQRPDRTVAKRMREYRARQRTQRARQPARKAKPAPQRVDRADSPALSRLEVELTPPLAPAGPRPYRALGSEPPAWTFSRRLQLLNLLHLRIAPGRVAPWLADLLATDVPSAQHAALARALNDLAQALDAIDPAFVTNLRAMDSG